ncbi:MAG: nucleoside triphosphate pyrophosphohydrolase [Clostridia bacterium]|nr:nucleoside triphosphate pyrophosphohydrolase [Clostridia bacterium]
MQFQIKDKYDIEDLIDIVNVLRSDGGCPWDRKQTHHTLKENLLEETYEVFEAIDDNNVELLKEELGDVLLQVVFHSQIESESNRFNFSDVADGICKKLIIRHPHVFSSTEVKDADEVLTNWEKIKVKSKNQTAKQSLEGITKTLPTLLKAAKLFSKSKKLDIYSTNIEDLLDKINDKSDKLKQSEQQESELENTLGDLLFYICGVCAYMNINPEMILRQKCEDFLMSI